MIYLFDNANAGERKKKVYKDDENNSKYVAV